MYLILVFQFSRSYSVCCMLCSCVCVCPHCAPRGPRHLQPGMIIMCAVCIFTSLRFSSVAHRIRIPNHFGAEKKKRINLRSTSPISLTAPSSNFSITLRPLQFHPTPVPLTLHGLLIRATRCLPLVAAARQLQHPPTPPPPAPHVRQRSSSRPQHCLQHRQCSLTIFPSLLGPPARCNAISRLHHLAFCLACQHASPHTPCLQHAPASLASPPTILHVRHDLGSAPFRLISQSPFQHLTHFTYSIGITF